MHTFRIFGGQVGVSLMNRFLTVREEFHSNMLASRAGCNWLTDERLRIVSLGMLPSSSGPDGSASARRRTLRSTVHAQAYTLAMPMALCLLPAWWQPLLIMLS